MKVGMAKLKMFMISVMTFFIAVVFFSRLKEQAMLPCVNYFAASRNINVGSTSLTNDGQEATPHETVAKKKLDKPFAYYTLTESCLHPFFYKTIALGNTTRCDVYINSFNEKCQDEKIPVNFKYIFNSSTTWVTGRNMLSEIAANSGIKYQYHVFFDDDAILFHTLKWQNFCRSSGLDYGTGPCLNGFITKDKGLKYLISLSNEKDKESAYREWEDDLILNSPAMAVPNYARTTEIFQSYLLQKKKYIEVCSHNTDMQWITPTVYLDMIFVAYHNDALPLMLPYSSLFDSQSWWAAGLFQLFRARALLYKHVISNFKFTVINTNHHPYPRSMLPPYVLIDYLKKEAQDIDHLIDVRDHSIANLESWQLWEDRLFGDPVVCTGHLKFPITKHYKVKHKQNH